MSSHAEHGKNIKIEYELLQSTSFGISIQPIGPTWLKQYAVQYNIKIYYTSRNYIHFGVLGQVKMN